MTTEIHREDDLDDSSYQRREMFAMYGVAVYYAQTLEHGMVNVLSWGEAVESGRPTRELIEANTVENFEHTMGRLLKRLRPLIAKDSHLTEQLQQALETRNYLAHGFFRNHAENVMTVPGRELMMAELYEATDAFKATDAALQPVMDTYLTTLGITQERVQELLQEMLDNLPQDDLNDALG